MRLFVITYIGLPLSGRTTTLAALARRHGAQIATRFVECDRELHAMWSNAPTKMPSVVDLRANSGPAMQGALHKMQAATSDGLVLVVDPLPERADDQKRFFNELAGALEAGRFDTALPVAIQINKRDLADPASAHAVIDATPFADAPRFVTCALRDEGLDAPLESVLRRVADIEPPSSMSGERGLALNAFDPFDPSKRARSLPTGRIPRARRNSLRRAAFLLSGLAALLAVSAGASFMRLGYTPQFATALAVAALAAAGAVGIARNAARI